MKFDNMRHYDIKQPDKHRDERLLELLRQPHVQNYVEGIAKKLNDTFNNNVKVLVDIRPGARFRNIETKQEFIYEATMVPYKQTDIARLVLMESKRPPQDFEDQAYFIFRTAVAGTQTDIVLTEDAGERFFMAGREFVAMFAMHAFELIDKANSEEKDLIERAWRPR